MLTDDLINKIKDAANVVDVIQDFGFALRKESGDTYTCLCPFHDDRHLGSFKVSEKKNYYRCFSCGAHGSAVDFLIYHQGMHFTDAIKWLGVKYGIITESLVTPIRPTCAKPHTPPPPLPMQTFDPKLTTDLKVGNRTNTFCDWLRSLPWQDWQRANVDKMINNYLIGSGKEGHTIFWQVDEAGKVRTGKMMLYKPDGHRDKVSPHNFDYIHSCLLRAHYWDNDKAEIRTCFFGQHLLDFFPNATVNIVESEKTALLLAIAYGNPHELLWMACGGKSAINREKLEPFIKRGRFIALYPDKDGAEDWRKIADAIGYDKIVVNTQVMSKTWIPEDGPKADLADIIVRRLTTRNQVQTCKPNEPPKSRNTATIERLRREYPNFNLLMETFKLKAV